MAQTRREIERIGGLSLAHEPEWCLAHPYPSAARALRNSADSEPNNGSEARYQNPSVRPALKPQLKCNTFIAARSTYNIFQRRQNADS
jgi:hypothetical protein